MVFQCFIRHLVLICPLAHVVCLLLNEHAHLLGMHIYYHHLLGIVILHKGGHGNTGSIITFSQHWPVVPSAPATVVLVILVPWFLFLFLIPAIALQFELAITLTIHIFFRSANSCLSIWGILHVFSCVQKPVAKYTALPPCITCVWYFDDPISLWQNCPSAWEGASHT